MKRNLRSYLAGLGSSGSLLGAVAAAFIAITAIVGFSGLPSSSGSSSDAAVTLTSNAPEAAAVAAAAPGAAPAVTPATALLALAAAAVPGGTPSGIPVPGPGGIDDPGQPEVPGDPTPPPPPPPPPPNGDIAGLVGEVDDTVGGATGVDLGLAETAKPLTDVLDSVIADVTGGSRLGIGQTDLPEIPQVIGLGGAGNLHPRG